MEYFKSAASAFLAKGSPLANYTIGERDAWFEGRTIWSLHQGTCREDSSACSILIFDSTIPAHNPRKSSLALAKNTLRKLRTTRHPDVVKLLDSAETPTAVYIALEAVKPLGKALEEMKTSGKQKEEWICWGISKIASAIKFLNVDAASTHGTVRIESIFMAANGEWRLGGFELTSSLQDQMPTLYNHGGLIPDANRYAPPEVKNQGWASLRELEPHVLDSYMFALFIIEAYNGSLPPTISAVPPQGKIPSPIYQLIRRMMVPNAKNRLPTAQLLGAGQADGCFFAENRLFKMATGLDSFMLTKEEDRLEIMRQLKTSSDSFPPEFLQYKVMPALVNALNLASSNQQSNTLSTSLQANRILPLVLQIGTSLSDKEWTASVAPPLLKAYTSADRGVRMILLESLDLYAERFDTRAVSEKVWPNLLTGFGDTAAVIREATVKAILPLSAKLSGRILNNDLLRQLARTQIDVEAGIRTNTTILLGSLAPKLSLETRKKVLVPAFSRSLKDPFVHARNAGLMALMATSESFDGDDSAKLILPAITPCLVDREKMVRDQAKSALGMFLAKAEEYAKQLPDTAEMDNSLANFGSNNQSSNGNGMGSGGAQSVIASTASGAASALAGWTLSQFSKPADKSQLPSNSSIQVSAPREVLIPTHRAASPPSESSSALDTETAPSWSKQGDLMDVMDDEDDWTGFETAPIKKITTPGKKKMLGVKSATTKMNGDGNTTTTRSTLGNAKSAVTRKSLAVTEAADEDAWGEDGIISGESNEPSRGVHQVESLKKTSVPSRSESPASAFAKLPAWESSATNEWGAIDDDHDDEKTSSKAQSADTPIMSKDEKKAEMEKKREERRKRMAQLKESKAAKLASGLS